MTQTQEMCWYVTQSMTTNFSQRLEVYVSIITSVGFVNPHFQSNRETVHTDHPYPNVLCPCVFKWDKGFLLVWPLCQKMKSYILMLLSKYRSHFLIHESHVVLVCTVAERSLKHWKENHPLWEWLTSLSQTAPDRKKLSRQSPLCAAPLKAV